ncbi:MAG: FimV/HubP family polar landmark protein [Betaproteobacteria bacterium]
MNFAHCATPRLLRQIALGAALSLAFVSSGWAMSFFSPVVQSKKGEPLLAEIDLNDISAQEQIELRAGMASADIYKVTQVEFPNINGTPLDINVELMRRDGGRYYIKLSSDKAVSNNFIDLLIELRWSTGRLIKKFSIALSDTKVEAKAEPKASMPVISAVASTDSDKLVVERGDTASEIAVTKLEGRVSLDQMLLAMLRSNPDAFVASNVNRLKAGAVISMPTAKQAAEVSREDARKQIQIQAKEFDDYRAELANRAAGGNAPQASRDTSGKLSAQLDNSKAKGPQDKLTLSKPSKGNEEEKIARQREAQEVASRAAEIGRNVAELSKIASATASEAASGEVPVSAPVPKNKKSMPWLDNLTSHTLAPVGAGALIAFLVLIALWVKRARRLNNDQDIEGLPPLNVKFNLDLPEGNNRQPFIPSNTYQEAPQHEEGANSSFDGDPLAPRFTPSIPDISLNLDSGNSSDPFQVRIDLADELWNLGQLHTSRALMEEVAHEASGETQARALQWLAERG